jgi:hypothetical protein
LNIVGTLLLDRVLIASVPRQLSHNKDSRNNPDDRQQIVQEYAGDLTP